MFPDLIAQPPATQSTLSMRSDEGDVGDSAATTVNTVCRGISIAWYALVEVCSIQAP